MLRLALVIALLQFTQAQNFDGDIQIPQCECEALRACREEVAAHVRPCVDACAAHLTHPQWDETAGRRCFTDRVPHRPSECMLNAMRQTCAPTAGMTLAAEEMMPIMAGGSGPMMSEAGGGGGGMFRRFQQRMLGFFSDTFGESGLTYMNCVKTCRQQIGGFGFCQQRLGCALRRLPPGQMFAQLHAACGRRSGARQQRRAELCACLRRAGLQNSSCQTSDHEEANGSVQF